MGDNAMMHGGRLIAAQQAFPAAPSPFIDLSTGINPVGYPIPPLPDSCWTRLPEPQEGQALQEAAAACYGVRHPDMVVSAPGTQILIQLLPLLYPARLVGVLSPTYGEHLAVWGRAGIPVETADALEAFDVGVVCNPNNPDGRIVPQKTLLSLAERFAARGGFLLVDEAFADFMPNISLASYLPHPGLILLRSFGKTYGLAGLRLGFMLADHQRAATVRAALGPWAVSGPAVFVGRHALTDLAWLAQAAARCADEAARLDALLVEAGLGLVGGTTLFRLTRTPDAGAVANSLGAAGILVRPFAEQPEWLRFGLPGTASAWTRLQKALLKRPLGNL
jgi:cobalamin biosynthetic protein CobC